VHLNCQTWSCIWQYLCITDFHIEKDKLKDDLKVAKERIRSLEVDLRQAEAGGEELKKVMKAAVESEYVVCQKLDYEKWPRKDLEVSLVVDLQSLQMTRLSTENWR
jgi:hypothetical protein